MGSSSLQRVERLAELVLVGLRLRLDRDVDDRLWELERLEKDRVGRITKGVPGRRRLEADDGDDVACVDRLFVLAVVGVHLKDPANALLAALRGVEHGGALLKGAGVHTQVGELADERVAHDLESKSGKGLVVSCLALEGLAVLHVGTRGRTDVERARQEVDHGVEHRLDALVLESGAAQHGHGLAGDGDPPEGGVKIVRGDLLLTDVLLHDGVVEVRKDVDQLVASGLGCVDQAGRDLLVRPLLAHSLFPDERLHLAQVDHTLERAFGTDRQLHDCGTGLEPVADHVHGAIEVRADPVHLVDEADPRHVVLVGLPPHGLGLRFDTGDGVEDSDGAVEHAKRPLDLDGEVDVPRRVDDVDPVVPPPAGRGSRSDGDTAFLLLDHPVHGCGALVDLTHLVVAARVVQDPLGRGRLTSVDVRHDPDVPGPGKGEFANWAGHLSVSESLSVRLSDL